MDDCLALPLVGTGDVLEARVEGLLIGESGEVLSLLTGDQSFEVTLFSSLDDGGGREAEVPACGERYLAMLLARVKAILIIQQ